jgi:predicted DNA-binding protein
MSILEDESLCARLSPELYERLNLMSGNQYSEFFFKDMETIYKFEGMDRWPMVTEATAKNGSHILLSLVVFCPLKD